MFFCFAAGLVTRRPVQLRLCEAFKWRCHGAVQSRIGKLKCCWPGVGLLSSGSLFPLFQALFSLHFRKSGSDGNRGSPPAVLKGLEY